MGKDFFTSLYGSVDNHTLFLIHAYSLFISIWVLLIALVVSLMLDIKKRKAFWLKRWLILLIAAVAINFLLINLILPVLGYYTEL